MSDCEMVLNEVVSEVCEQQPESTTTMEIETDGNVDNPSAVLQPSETSTAMDIEPNANEVNYSGVSLPSQQPDNQDNLVQAFTATPNETGTFLNQDQIDSDATMSDGDEFDLNDPPLTPGHDFNENRYEPNSMQTDEHDIETNSLQNPSTIASTNDSNPRPSTSNNTTISADNVAKRGGKDPTNYDTVVKGNNLIIKNTCVPVDGFRDGFDIKGRIRYGKGYIVDTIPDSSRCEFCVRKRNLKADGSYDHLVKVITRVVDNVTNELTDFYLITLANHPRLYQVYPRNQISTLAIKEYNFRKLYGGTKKWSGATIKVSNVETEESIFKKGPTIYQKCGEFNQVYNHIFQMYLDKNLVSAKTLEFYEDVLMDISKVDMIYNFWKELRQAWDPLLTSSNFYIEPCIAGSNDKTKDLLSKNKRKLPDLKGYYIDTDTNIRKRVNREVRLGKTALITIMPSNYNGHFSSFCHTSVLVIKNGENPEAFWYDPSKMDSAFEHPPKRIQNLLPQLRVDRKLTIMHGRQTDDSTDCHIRSIIFIAIYCDNYNPKGLPTRKYDLIKRCVVNDFNY